MINKSTYLLSSLSWGVPGAPGKARQILALLLVTAPWGGLLAWLSHVAWFLCDDAFISFRYARNLLKGHGLVFNPGEYVEGYSNFLWTLELAHRRSGFTDRTPWQWERSAAEGRGWEPLINNTPHYIYIPTRDDIG